MNAERHQQVKQIFLAACELDPPQVAAFLDRASGGDAELRQEVESLLRYHLSETIMGGSSTPAGPATHRDPLLPGAADVDPGSGLRPERFPPGTILAGRYRIIGPLGRGGMGDVYRADDLKLNQAVALKFLAKSRSSNPLWLRQYQNEVRLARKVTHPNVLRVYDISEAEGEVFISMEYVDGEDLASLLRRIGRLTGDKAVQVAHQLCAGLGAAHDQGVLHRDLKPANIMIDGRGQVRIADFGIAALASQAEENGASAGTPAFMAPELFEGGAPSVRSDLYSLGTVLYEMTTGRAPFEGASPGLRTPNITPLRPSAIAPETDAGLERVILRCLERDPKRRPDSAYAVAAALPGGDPLVLALAAGETPSPSMVAAAGCRGAWRPWIAASCLTIALLGLFLVVRLADRTFFLPQAGLEKSPIVLADKAEHIIAAMGRGASSQEHWQGSAMDRGYLQHAATTDSQWVPLALPVPRPERPKALAEPVAPAVARTTRDSIEHAATMDAPHRMRESLSSGRPPAVCFWYRTAVNPITSPISLELSPAQSAAAEPDMVTVRLDGRGRLLQYMVMSDRSRLSGTTSRPVDWSPVFALAGLPGKKFKPSRPVREPPGYADALAAWEGFYPETPGLPIRVEGASLGGRPVFFEVAPPWNQDWTDADEGPSRLPRRAPLVRSVLYLLAIIAGGFLAWHNLRLGRGDQRGASKLLGFVLLLGLLDWLLGERHVAVFSDEVALLSLWLARATLLAAIAGVSYFAVEPYVRRYWPEIMITWSRLLGGKVRDPLVGRDILLGGLCGILLVLIMQLDILLPSWLGSPSPLPKLPGTTQDLAAVLGLRYKLSIVVASLMTSILLTLVILLLMLVLRVAIRHAWLATAVSWLLLVLLLVAASGYDVSYPWLTSAMVAAVAMIALVRVGLVALVVSLFFWSFLINSPITSNLWAWYAPSSTFAVLLATALLVYGFFTARAGQPMLWHRLLDS